MLNIAEELQIVQSTNRYLDFCVDKKEFNLLRLLSTSKGVGIDIELLLIIK